MVLTVLSVGWMVMAEVGIAVLMGQQMALQRACWSVLLTVWWIVLLLVLLMA